VISSNQEALQPESYAEDQLCEVYTPATTLNSDDCAEYEGGGSEFPFDKLRTE